MSAKELFILENVNVYEFPDHRAEFFCLFVCLFVCFFFMNILCIRVA